jgi:polyisoprenoid-binding protein YceI
MQTTQDQLAVPRRGRYTIDTAKSRVSFKTRHMFGLAPVRGSFAIRAGTVDVLEPLAQTVITAEIDVASFRTGNPARDNTVRSARLLDASQHPVISFTSSGIDGASVNGALTAHGVSRNIGLRVGQVSVSPAAFAARGAVRIDRTAFGVTGMRGLAGRYLDITVEVRCVLR